MIDIKELRIGNSFIDIQTGFHVVITNINHDGYVRIFGGGNTVGAHISELKPIELSEDVLFKHGFKKDEGDFYFKDILYLYEHHTKCNVFQIDGYSSAETPSFLYLHEIQNLYFSLTKKELIND